MATSTSDSGIEAEILGEEHFHLNSAFYQDILVLRISFMNNGKPARITGASRDSGSPQLYCSDTGMSVSISAVTKACTSILHKHGVSHSHVHCDDQSPLLLFQYRPGLIELLLPECDKIAQDVSTAVKAIFKRSDASVSIRVEAAARFYLISPSKNGTPETLLITPSNVHQCSDRLDKSKEFLFSSSMFAEPMAKAESIKPGSTKVDFNELVQILWKSSDKWLPLGLHLCIPQDNLRKIRKDHSNWCDDCLISMLEWWYKNSRPSWSRVMSALCAIDRRDIAKEISTKYGIKCPPGSPMTKDTALDHIDELQPEVGETIKSRNRAKLGLREANTSVSTLTRECKRLRNEREELKKDLAHERQQVKTLTDVKQEYAERINEREENIDSLEEVIDKKEQELDRCKEIIKTLSSQIEQNERKISDLEEELRTTIFDLQTTKGELNNAIEQLSVKQNELEHQSKRLKSLEETEAIWIDQLIAKEEFGGHLRKLKRAMSQGSTTTIEAFRQLSFAEIQQRKCKREVDIREKDKIQLAEEITNMKYRLMEKKLRLFDMSHTAQQLEVSLDSALQTEIAELTGSLTEAMDKEEETEMKLSIAQKEYDQSVENVRSKQALIQKIDSENRARKVYPATLRHNSSPSKLDMDDYKVEEDRFTGPMVDTQLLNIGN